MAATASSPAAKRAKLPNKLSNKRPHYFTPVQHHHQITHSSSSPSPMANKPPPQHQSEQSEEQEEEENSSPLLPGLPDDLARQCLAGVPPAILFAVCHGWRRFMYSPSYPNPSSSVYALLAGDSDDDSSLSFSSYDPFSAEWEPLPPPPLPSPLLLKHSRFLSRLLPIQTLTSSSSLLLISASTPDLQPALHSPLIFHPSPPQWLAGPAFPISPRRWCAAGSLNGSIHLFSGVGSLHYNATLARSAFKWDASASACNWKWEPVASLKDASFSREAVEAVASDNKLWMVNLRGRCHKEGLAYNAHVDHWDEMPPGLLSGWIGPATADHENNNNIYVADDETGTLKLYDWATDAWRTVVTDERLRGATQMAARGGKVCVVAGGGAALVVVDVKGSGYRRIWTVDPPPGKKLLNVHILPRMSRGDS